MLVQGRVASPPSQEALPNVAPEAATSAPSESEPDISEEDALTLWALTMPRPEDFGSPSRDRIELLRQQLLTAEACSWPLRADAEGIRQTGLAASIRMSLRRLLALETEDLLHAGDGAGNSGAAGLAVPAPDPRNPVDYLAWAIAVARAESSAAASLLDAAIHAGAGSGPSDLVDNALRNDAEALSSPEIEDWVEANREAIESLLTVGRHDSYGIQFQSQDDSLLGITYDLGALFHVAKAAILDGRLMVRDGAVQPGLDRFVDVLVAAPRIGRGPSALTDLAAIAIRFEASQALLDAFAADVDQQFDYAQLAERLQHEVIELRPAAEAIQYDRATVLDEIQRAYRYDDESGGAIVAPDAADRLAHDYRPAVLFMIRTHLSEVGFESLQRQANAIYDELTRAARLPYPDARPLIDAFEARVDDPDFTAGNLLIRPLIASFAPRLVHLAPSGQLHRRALLVVTNLRAYRKAHGQYPDDLAALGIDTTDPFSNRPLRYRCEGDDFILYTVGPNGTDDGGRHGSTWDEGDFRYWPRPGRPLRSRASESP